MFSKIFTFASALLALTNVAQAAVTPEMSVDERSVAKRSLSGQATFYGGNVQGGMCSFSTYTLPAGLYGTALSSSNWADAYNCGGCVAVHHGGKTITAMIVDQCPGCGENHLDLFPTAFSDLANPSAGIISTTWEYVPCPDISGPLEIHMKSGSSQYYFAAQVVNAKRRTAKLQVSTNQGKTWMGTERQDYNFFNINSGTGTNSAWVKVTSHVGTTVVIKDVPMTGDAITKASKNYA